MISQRRLHFTAFWVGALLVPFAANAARGAVEYRIVALEVLPGGVDSLAFGLNDLGQVVGDSRKDRSTHVGQSRPVVWNYHGEPVELWTDQDVGGSLADINNIGQIVGRYGSGSGIPLPTTGVPYGRGFVWDAVNGRQDLGLAPIGNSQAVAINDAGQVVGTSEVFDPANGFVPHAFIWDSDDGIRSLGDLGGRFTFTFATGINNLGQVVGYGGIAGGEERAFVWDQIDGMRELPSFAGGSTRVLSINDHSQILGDEVGIGGLIWRLPTGGPEIAPVLGGYAISSSGEVVGGGGGGQAFIWDDASDRRLLVEHISPELDWQLEFAFGINNAGDIAGYGHRNDMTRGFLLVSVPEPSMQILGSCLIVRLIGTRRCRQRRRIQSIR